MEIILGIPIRGIPRPWEYFDVKAIMVNAYELIKMPRILGKIREKGLRKFLNFDGLIYVDSGGYQYLKYKISIDVKDIGKIYKSLDADYFVTLDQPPSNNKASNNPLEKEAYLEKILKKNIRNFKVLRNEYKIENLIPVVHPPLSFAKREYTEYLSIDCFNAIAFGGLVPYFFPKKGLEGSKKKGLSMLYNFRSIHSHNLHVMGLGSPSLIPLLDEIGVDSTDSSTWRIKAAFGKIILPGIGERHITNKKVQFGNKKVSEAEIEYISRIIDEMRIGITLKDLRESFTSRALFNAFVLLRYNKVYRRDANPYKALFSYISKLKNEKFN